MCHYDEVLDVKYLSAISMFIKEVDETNLLDMRLYKKGVAI